MQILMNTGGIASTNCFVVADESAGLAVIFDAPNDTVTPLLDEAKSRGWNITGLWLTHGHFDHIADHAVVTERCPSARVLIHALDEPKLLRPASSLFPLPFVIPPRRADEYVVDGQERKIGCLNVRVMHTPGHSPGHVCYYFPDQDILIGGDLIIGGSVGRTDLPDADPEQLDESIRHVMKLPDGTRLLPGHGGPGTLGDERENNEYVRRAIGL